MVVVIWQPTDHWSSKKVGAKLQEHKHDQKNYPARYGKLIEILIQERLDSRIQRRAYAPYIVAQDVASHQLKQHCRGKSNDQTPWA
jgi:hypothetical protein